jgi:prepilin-type processing-associated H-X9-DG protein
MTALTNGYVSRWDYQLAKELGLTMNDRGTRLDFAQVPASEKPAAAYFPLASNPELKKVFSCPTDESRPTFGSTDVVTRSYGLNSGNGEIGRAMDVFPSGKAKSPSGTVYLVESHLPTTNKNIFAGDYAHNGGGAVPNDDSNYTIGLQNSAASPCTNPSPYASYMLLGVTTATPPIPPPSTIHGNDTVRTNAVFYDGHVELLSATTDQNIFKFDKTK